MATRTTTTTRDEKMVTLKSRDGQEFIVKESVAVQSQTLKHMLEDLGDCSLSAIPVSNVDGKTLGMIIEYCSKHANEKDEDDLKKYDDEFVAKDLTVLFDLLMAANYLDVKGLMEIMCQKVADSIKDKSVEEVRKIFNIKNDFTREEEEKIRKENAWAFE